MTRRNRRILGIGLLVLAVSAGWAPAQESDEPAGVPPWSGRFDLGLSLTEGNSNTETFNARGQVERVFPRARFRFTVDGLEADTADDRFSQVDPGFIWLPGEGPPADTTSTLVEPGIEPDVEKYYLEALYERTAFRTPKLAPGVFNWHVGASWDRNVDAGLIGRTVAFLGVGHDWWDREDLLFRTRYSLSYTDRNEETPDPEKDETFYGYRLSWLYRNRWGPRVYYENELKFNMSFSDQEDYSAQMRHELDVPMSKRLSLTVSLQWLYNNFPALETVDVIGLVATRDPDGVPGSGDEFFETVDAGGTAVGFGTTRVRKKSLDTVISTSLRVTF